MNNFEHLCCFIKVSFPINIETADPMGQNYVLLFIMVMTPVQKKYLKYFENYEKEKTTKWFTVFFNVSIKKNRFRTKCEFKLRKGP